jgi:TonB-linked SusC/RagA family outer membrane protein
MKVRCLLFFRLWLVVPLLTLATQVSAQTGQLTGKVLDPKGGSAIGATIVVKGTTNGTSVGANGTFTISGLVNGDYTLVISSVGYTGQDVAATVPQTQPLRVTLAENATSLNDVVVVGYGTQKREDVTGAVATVDPKALQDLPVVTVDQRLTGQVAGVQVSTTTGTPGGGPTIKIRGSGSIGAGDQPLFVIDGFPIASSANQTENPLNLLNPDDIETLTVLKDASSTAIYGSRGANGVVVITTKHGRAGVTNLDVNAYTGIQQVPQKGRPNMLTGQEFAQFRQDIITDAFKARGATPTAADIPIEFQNPAQYGAGTNWYNEIVHTAPQRSVNVSLSKGTEDLRASLSLGYLDQEGTVRYTDYKRYTARLNVEGKVGSKIRLGLSLAPTYSIQKGNDYETGFTDVLSRSLWLSPLVPVTDANGVRTPYITSPGMYSGPNPFNSLEFAFGTTRRLQGIGGTFAEYTIVPWLRARYSLSINYNNSNNFSFNPSFVGGVNSPPPSIPSSNSSNDQRFNWLSEALLSYDKKIGENHTISAVAGYSAQKEQYQYQYLNATNYASDDVQTINAASLIPSFNADVQEWSLISYLARINYAFKDRFLLTGTIRTDGSSRFGANKRYGTFPSVAVGWNIINEGFMQGFKSISNLKVRASYGQTGNYNIGNYTTIANVDASSTAFGGQLAPGRALSSLANPNLTWEKSNQFDAGLDISFWQNRLAFTADVYRRITNGILLNNQLPTSSGYSNAIINSGKVLNRGLELSLNTRNLTGAFTWNTSLNIAFNRNEVLALNGDNAPIYSGRSGEGSPQHITQVGRPIGEFFGYVVEGVYATQADFDNSPKHVTSVLGSIKYRDVDGNGVIEPTKDFAVIGHAQPNYTWGVTNQFSFKGVDLNVIFVGSQGGQVLKTANQYLLNVDGIFNVDRKVLDRWRSPEQPGNGHIPTTNGARVIFRDTNSDWVESSSFARLQNVTLGYHLPASLLARTGFIKGVRLYASGQNLLLISNYSGANPEANRNGSSVLTPGEDFLNYPLARTIVFGTNLSF